MLHKKNIYVCATLYHLLISLIYCSKDSEKKSKIIVLASIVNAKDFVKKIKVYYPMIEVQFLDDYQMKRQGAFYSRKVHQLYRSSMGQGELYLYNDYCQIGYYLHRNKIPYTLLEDGLNCLQHPYSIPRLTYKSIIKNWLTNTPRYHGFSRFCKKIIVNEIAGIPVDSRYPKFEEQPKKELFSQLSFDEKEKLLAVFEVSPLVVQEPAVLILTQPLEAEFPEEAEKLEFWKSLIDKYRADGYYVYVKVHPRDTLDYTSFPVTILPKNVPAELLDFVVDKPFALGVTYYSTALEYMTCVQEKVYLHWEK